MHRLFYLVILPLLAFLSCNTTEPPPGKGSISLSVEDVSCTEAWFRIETSNISFPQNITIFKDNQVSEIINLINSDTLFYVDSLKSNSSYSFRCSIGEYLGKTNSSDISVHTLDTTSNNITWQTYLLGSNKIQSILEDATIVDENNVWITGQLYLDDSLGNMDPEKYNLIKWDGNNLQVNRVYYYDQYGQAWSADISSIYTFNANDIWLANFTHWNGSKYESVNLNIPLPYQIMRSWGTSFNDFYMVGASGMIAKHDDGGWTKIESGTSEYIFDIWGDNNDIYCASLNNLIQIKDDRAIIKQLPDGMIIHSVWFKNSNKMYAGGIGVFEKIYNFVYQNLVFSFSEISFQDGPNY